MATRASTAKQGLTDALAWLVNGRGRGVAALLLVLLAGQLAFAWYDTARLGLPLVREEPASFDLAHLLQSAFAVALSGLLILALVRARARPCGLDVERCRGFELAAGLAALAAAGAATALFLLDPAAFHAAAQEDQPLEWSSALLLLGAGALLAVHALRRSEPVAMVLAGGLCLALLVIGMEEISWGQRIFGFATPERLAEMNWQAEFNFHNVQTDLSETLYYVGAAAFLILLPLLRDLVPTWFVGHPLAALAPHRSVALVSAPVALFNYGHWNLLPVQLGILLAFGCLGAWAWAAARRGDRAEQAVYGLAAVAVAAGQSLFLVFGPAMIDLPDATEYKEFFIGLGFAWYAVTVVGRKASTR